MPQVTTTLLNLGTYFKSQVTASARPLSSANYTDSQYLQDLPHVVYELLAPPELYKPLPLA